MWILPSVWIVCHSVISSSIFYLAEKMPVCTAADGGVVASDQGLPRSSFVSSPQFHFDPHALRSSPRMPPCLGLASGTAPKLAPAFKQIHSSFLSAGAEGGGYYPRVEMSSNGRGQPATPGYNTPPLHHSHLSRDWNWTSWEESFNHLSLVHIELLSWFIECTLA